MKKTLVIILTLVIIVSITACGEKTTNENPSEKISTTESKTVGDSFEEPTESATENGDERIEINYLQAVSSLESLIQRTEGIVYGEVIAEAEPVHTNPDGRLMNGYGEPVEYAMKYQYSFRVDESFVGDVQKDDVIKVNVFNDYHIPYGTDPENVYTNYVNYHLKVGEKYVLFIYFWDRRTAEENPTPETVGYETNGWKEGVFGECEDGMWRSLILPPDECFTLEELPGLIAKHRIKE